MDWQPIETAPKDGRKILVRFRYENDEEFDEIPAYWDGGWCSVAGRLPLEVDAGDELTHWQPLAPDTRSS